MNPKLRSTLYVFIATTVAALVVTALLFARFFLLPDGEIFRWLSADGIETWGGRYDLLPLAILSALAAVIGGGTSFVFIKKEQLSASLTTSILTAITVLLFLLSGLRFF